MEKNEPQVFQIGWQTLWRIFFFGILVYLIFQARSALGVLFVSVVLSLGLDPVVSFLERRRVNRLLGTAFVFLFGGAMLTGVFFLVIPLMVTETVGFLSAFNQTLLSLFGVGLPSDFIRDISTNLSRIVTFLEASNISVGGVASRVFGPVIFLLATLVVSFYLSVEKKGTEHLLRVILPRPMEASVLRVFDRFKKKVSRWFGAQLALSFLVGFAALIGLWVLGVRYPFALALFAGLFELVPVIGPIIAGLFAVIVAFSDSALLSLYVVIFFVFVQQLENHIFIPLIMGRTMKVHPVIVVVALLAGAQVAGFVGIFLAVPIAVLLQEAFEYLVERKAQTGTS